MVSLIASSSSFESNLPFACQISFPRLIRAVPLRFGRKILSDRRRYACLHSSADNCSRPSMTAIKLFSTSEMVQIGEETYPPVLVPPIRSKTWYGLSRESGDRSWLMPFMMSSMIIIDDNPRTPPPSAPVLGHCTVARLHDSDWPRERSTRRLPGGIVSLI